MKLALVLVIAKYLEIRTGHQEFQELVIPALVTLVPMAIILKQPDFGTAVLFSCRSFLILFVGEADVSPLFQSFS